MQEANWTRWITSSIYKHFSGISIKLFLEGDERDTNKYKEWAELRLVGPTIRTATKDEWLIDLIIDILVSINIHPTDLYRMQRLIGEISEFFIDIPIYKYGDGDSYLGCMQRKGTGHGNLDITPWGQVDKDTKIIQASIEGQYILILK